MISTTLQFPDDADENVDVEPSRERAHAHSMHDPTEVAQVMAQRIHDSLATPDEAVRDLRRLISYRLSVPSPALRRLGHLDLLFQLVMTNPDAVLTYDGYNAERERRAARGEKYPTAKTLSEHYGGWDGALGVAERFRDLGGEARTKYTHKQSRVKQQSYDAIEVSRAIIACRKHIGDWPTEYEFEQWGCLARAAHSNARVPWLLSVRKAYGSYADGLRITREVYEGRRSDEQADDEPHAA